MLIMQHDGRHIGRMPEPGVDGVVVDAPCSGTATTRKNRELWKSWTPKVGRSLFKLQSDIATRAAQLCDLAEKWSIQRVHSTLWKMKRLFVRYYKDALGLN